jgi:hypothetical protein
VELSDIICPRDLRDEREDTKIKMRDVNQAKSKTIQNLQNERLYKWPKRFEEHNREAIRPRAVSALVSFSTKSRSGKKDRSIASLSSEEAHFPSPQMP